MPKRSRDHAPAASGSASTPSSSAHNSQNPRDKKRSRLDDGADDDDAGGAAKAKASDKENLEIHDDSNSGQTMTTTTTERNKRRRKKRSKGKRTDPLLQNDKDKNIDIGRGSTAAEGGASGRGEDSNKHTSSAAMAVDQMKKKTRAAIKKRPLLPGTVRRLAVPRPVSLAASSKNPSGSTKEDVNRRGNKISKGQGTGGFASAPPFPPRTASDTAALGDDEDEDIGEPTSMAAIDLDDTVVVGDDDESGSLGGIKDKGKGKEREIAAPVRGGGAELWVTRKTTYPAYLRAGLAAFSEKGHRTLTLRALGAAIPNCLSLAMAIREALPGGDTSTTLQVRTGSVDVNDEVLPPDDNDDGNRNGIDSDEAENMDIQYQVRTKSSVECVISLRQKARNHFLVSSTGVSAVLHGGKAGGNGSGIKQMGVRPGRGGARGGGGRPLRGGSARGGGRGGGGAGTGGRGRGMNVGGGRGSGRGGRRGGGNHTGARGGSS